jgi:hypothetical protein
MVRFQCESCGRLKGDGETWIASSWDRPRAVDLLAVHFCSDECRATYMNALFSDSPDTLGGVATATTRRIKRVVPGAVVDTVIAEKARRKTTRRTAARRKTA